MKIWGDLLALGAAAATQALRVRVKTNLGPALTLYDAGARDPAGAPGGAPGLSLTDALGVKVALWVEGPGGVELYRTGPTPATDPMRAALLLALAGGLVFVIVRGLTR